MVNNADDNREFVEILKNITEENNPLKEIFPTMEGIRIEQDGIVMSYCCDKLESHLKWKSYVRIQNFEDGHGKIFKSSVVIRASAGVCELTYCPFCGEKINIIKRKDDSKKT